MNDNFIVLNLGQQDQITGGGAEADVVGPHAVLGCQAKLLDVCGSALVQAAGSADVKVYYGADKTATAVLSAAMTFTPTVAKAKGTIADKSIVYDSGSEFCLGENTTSSKTVDRLSVQLYFQQTQALPA